MRRKDKYKAFIFRLGVARLIMYSCAIFLTILIFVIFYYKFHEDKVMYVNPYMGFAPPAEGGPFTQPHSLVYANLLWSEIEPEKGFYDFETIENKYKLDYWKEQHVKFIFRIVLDYPQQTKHKDIPDWLYDETNGDGTWYEHEWGQGFSPNYYNKTLINYHEKLIQALAERYNDELAIAFIELGSLGHWGEWHTIQDNDIHIPFPTLPVAETYVNHYVAHFDKKILLMRHPHQMAIDYKMGLYNDMFGNVKETEEEFWYWVEHGFDFWLTQESNPPMPDYWKHAPTGGEFDPTEQWEHYFSSSNFFSIIDQLELTHVSWLGPYSPAYYPPDGKLQGRIDRLLNKMGYHFRLVEEKHPRKVMQGTAFELEMLWENSGVAPFYFSWPLEVSLSNTEGDIFYNQILDCDIRAWLPGKHKVNVAISLPPSLPAGRYNIHVAILNPENMEPGMYFAMKKRRSDGRYTIGNVTVK